MSDGFGDGEFGIAPFGGTPSEEPEIDYPKIGDRNVPLWYIPFGRGPFGGHGYRGLRDTDYYDATVELLDALPEWYDEDEESPNADFLRPVGEQIELLDIEALQIARASMVQTAWTREQLDDLGSIVNVSARYREPIEHLRRRIMARMLISKSKGTVPDLMRMLALILDTDIENIRNYRESYGYGGVAEVDVDPEIIEDSIFEDEEIGLFMRDTIKPTGRVYINKPGTLVFVSPETYENRDDWSDYEHGYDGLNSDGNPKEEGGTYGGVIGSQKPGDNAGYGTSYGTAWGDS